MGALLLRLTTRAGRGVLVNINEIASVEQQQEDIEIRLSGSDEPLLVTMTFDDFTEHLAKATIAQNGRFSS